MHETMLYKLNIEDKSVIEFNQNTSEVISDSDMDIDIFDL
jgi:hypothetical protein